MYKAIEKFKLKSERENYIKEKFDKKFGKSWICTVTEKMEGN
jgi:hypothetical protein